MRRRSRAGGEPVKTRRRKTVTRKNSNAPKAERRRSSSAANLQEQLDLRTRELSEALEALQEPVSGLNGANHDRRPIASSDW
jgi:hypothetical protein